ncbi:hypothetical protein QA646_26825 (plasmid) [Rhizobium sp. CB3090]|uniref:hypothetical protein n=1 Tax=Rhizobium sp. CB3090 TaxID=3039156 RepID=UPI0024B0F54C|nr:hypothetical protein [Rhizobium sp. CB3090]WFU11991.1 hypothetical protein QA646_26825 [Rhizobium sp. CB3090]
MDPAQGMIADTKLPGIVRDDHHVAQQAVMAQGTPQTSFGQDPDPLPVENIDALAG